jgi:hypothetical protein
MKIQNTDVQFDFDDHNGSLARILDQRSGIHHLSDLAAGRLFRIIVPDTEMLTLDPTALRRAIPKRIHLHRENGSAAEQPFTVVEGKVHLSVDLQHWECAVIEIE